MRELRGGYHPGGPRRDPDRRREHHLPPAEQKEHRPDPDTPDQDSSSLDRRTPVLVDAARRAAMVSAWRRSSPSCSRYRQAEATIEEALESVLAERAVDLE